MNSGIEYEFLIIFSFLLLVTWSVNKETIQNQYFEVEIFLCRNLEF